MWLELLVINYSADGLIAINGFFNLQLESTKKSSLKLISETDNSSTSLMMMKSHQKLPEKMKSSSVPLSLTSLPSSQPQHEHLTGNDKRQEEKLNKRNQINLKLISFTNREATLTNCLIFLSLLILCKVFFLICFAVSLAKQTVEQMFVYSRKIISKVRLNLRPRCLRRSLIRKKRKSCKSFES